MNYDHERQDARGEAEFSRMLSEHSRRRTGATGFVAPWAENKVNPNNALHREMLGFALLTPTYGLFQWGFPEPHRWYIV